MERVPTTKKLPVGSVVRAPWRIYGDDANLTGVVYRNARGRIFVRWNDDGDTTSAGDETMFYTTGDRKAGCIADEDIVSVAE